MSEEVVSLRYLGDLKDPNGGPVAFLVGDSYYHFDPDGEVRAADVHLLHKKAEFRQLSREEIVARAKKLKDRAQSVAEQDELSREDEKPFRPVSRTASVKAKAKAKADADPELQDEKVAVTA